MYFTCHPADFEKCFDKVCEDIFEAHDCAVYYTEDMTETIPAEDLATDLGSNNLFVIPVTFNPIGPWTRILSMHGRSISRCCHL